jgi:hypothetical protein
MRVMRRAGTDGVGVETRASASGLRSPFEAGGGVRECARDRQNKKVGDPRGGWVRIRKRTRVTFFLNIFFIVFFNSPHRETPKNVIKKNREKVGFGFLVEFFVKTFRHDFFQKHEKCFSWCF